METVPRRAFLVTGALGLLGMSLAATAGCVAPAERQRAPEPLRVASFNLRYGTADDGPDRWELRREFALDLVGELDAQVLALQEALDFQLVELRARYPRYRQLGQHRGGGTKDEFSGLLVDEVRLEVEGWGELWLSPTPDVLGSKGWDAALPRMAVWARLRDRASGARFVALGTHFDHRGERARLESARLLAATARERSEEFQFPVVLMGDLNAGETSPPCAELRSAGFVDSFRVLHPDAAEVGTFSAFRDERSGVKIDYVWVTPNWRVLGAEIVLSRRDGRCPSDHDPVVATLAFAASAD
jgi:endonuclease/exonuclease/phosphatase family metal-dependent hydrolase